VATGSIDHWQSTLDQDGSVVIRSRRQGAALALAACVALVILALVIAVGGGVAGVVIGVVIIIGVASWAPRIAGTVISGQPHLVVTADDVTYGHQSVRWTSVTEIVRHTMTVRGNIQTYVWLLHGHDRLRLPQSLQADLTQLELWLRDVHSRRGQTT
jgi:hypothetical protein